MPSRLVALALAAALLSCSGSSSGGPSAPTGSPSEAKYLALGDSFTAGTGATPDESFPARLVAHWGCATGPVLLDLGVDGYTTDDLISEELPQLSRFLPGTVTLAIGANDIVRGSSEATYRAHVRQILAAVVAAGAKQIVTIPQPDWAKSPAALAFGSEAALRASIVAFNGILQAETAAVSGQYVDLFPLMEQQASAHMLARDGLHPSAAAYDAWGAALANAMTAPCVPTPTRRASQP